MFVLASLSRYDSFMPVEDPTTKQDSELAGGIGSVFVLPDEPVYVIGADLWSPFNLGELWHNRELIYFMVWRDVKVRYKQTLLGASWAIIQPLFTMLVFNVFFGRLAQVPSDGLPYPVFSYAGLLPWTFFSNAVGKGSGSLVSQSRMVTKSYFPRIILPATPIGVGLVDFASAMLVYFGLMAWYGLRPGFGILMLPVLIALTATVALGTSLLFSIWMVKYRDIRQVVPFVIQIWMFASPVIYPTTMVPDKWRWILMLNPMTGIIDGFRACLLDDRPFDWPALGLSFVIATLLLLFSTYVFRRTERTVADHI